MTTPSMEDHLEQIYLLSLTKGYTRVSDVADALSILPSSASKMAQKLGESGYIEYEKYGRISLTGKGTTIGKQLLDRHRLLERFLRQIGVPEQRIEREVEQLEHHFSWGTLELLRNWLHVLEERQATSKGS
ncbi:transcriptional regulator MntR [Paenibacillus arenilitoris]|uniref:Manganese transport regulator n=1 Tax=Paenibacillus arenilitoris TaxID=2772299 RepID=A0A927CF65_9BACL|nr:transcriptional regulator MntR [Paenibacillus arenilitoris]MBD2866953.1 transcriptional regulator MntR [Paenibacillus arenilitoris]